MYTRESIIMGFIALTIWIMSGVIMQWTIVNRIEDDGSYSAWFGDRILIFEADKE